MVPFGTPQADAETRPPAADRAPDGRDDAAMARAGEADLQAGQPGGIGRSGRGPSGRGLGLGGQLAALWGVVLVTLAVSVGGVALWTLEQRTRREVRQRLVEGADVAASVLAVAVRDRGVRAAARRREPWAVPARWVALLRRVQRQSGAEALWVAAPGRVRIRLGRGPGGMAPASDPDLRAALTSGRAAVRRREVGGDAWLLVYRPVIVPGADRLAVRLAARPEALVADRIGPIRRAILWIVLLNFGLALLLGGVFLRRRVLGPLRELERASARVASGDPAARIPPVGNPALDAVGARFNDMLDRLAAKDRRLLAQVQALERQQRELDQSWEVLLRSAKLASVGRLAAGIAHELGNPLSSLFGYLELLDGDDLPSDRRSEIIGKIRDELARMDGTIRALLDAARPGEDRVGRLDLPVVVTRAAELVKAQRRLRNVDIHLRLGEVPPVAASTRLDQVFVNLFLNAGDALEGTGRVDVWAEVGPEQVCVYVADSGPGIPESLRKSLFDPFVSSKPPGEGTGLGLSVSLSIVEASGGRLRLSNPQPEQGAQFEVWLPRWTESAAEQRPRPSGHRRDEPTP